MQQMFFIADMLHLVGILFTHINEDPRSKSLQTNIFLEVSEAENVTPSFEGLL
jgi:hypothetical protein